MHTMLLAALLVSGAAAADHGDCTQLTQLKLPDVRITEATAVAAGTGAIRVAHCRVAGVIGTEIKFSLLLPEQWNHKFLMGGGGGFVGSVQNQAQFVVNDGYATAGTDTGHQGGVTDASWALNNEERRLNYGYLAVHRTAETAKAILRRYYGANETRAYFSGCSNGGRQGLMEAQRYPDDFDGIVAGAPAADFTAIGAQFLKDVRAQFPDPKNLAPVLPADTLRSIASQILDRCDAIDGVKDGVLDDPRRCRIDVSTFTGLTPAQLTALEAIYAPTRAGGDTVFPGQPFGGEGEVAGWPAWISGAAPREGQPAAPSLRYSFATQLFKYLVFNDPDWDYTKYRPLDLAVGHQAHRGVPQRDQLRPRGVQRQRPQAAALARMGRRRAFAARHHSILRFGQVARCQGERLHADVPAAWRAALRRRAGSGQRRLGGGDRRLGRDR